MKIFASTLLIAAAVATPHVAFAQSSSPAPMHTIEQAKPLPLPLAPSQASAATTKATPAPASKPDHLVRLPATDSASRSAAVAPAKSTAAPVRTLPPLKLQPPQKAPKAVRDSTHG